MEPHGVRKRRPSGGNIFSPTSDSDPYTSPNARPREEIVWGKTPNGTVFRVPTTHDVLTSLFHPWHPKSHLDLVNLTLLGLQLVLFGLLPNKIGKSFFFVYFVFWRAAYNAGLGWVLTKQSKKRWIVREVQRRAWLDEEKRPVVRSWIKNQLAGRMGKDYSFDDLPPEYNIWLLFRQAVDIILLNDFLAYCMFAFSCFRVPDGLSLGVHVMRWIGGVVLIAFNLWVKTEAHHVVKDYGWYWGDVFFQRGALVFDGVFELAPHPMYSVGYAGYYGLSLIVGSYPVLFISLAAHAAQFAFLICFENPHIERMYGKPKPIAQRAPLSTPPRTTSSPPALARQRPLPSASDAYMSTPMATEGETTETETELETELDAPYTTSSTASAESLSMAAKKPRPRVQALTQHDLMNRYFRNEVIILRNIDLLRASDFKLVMLIVYAIVLNFIVPRLRSDRTLLAFHLAHALSWRFFHSFGLGIMLRAQSESKFLVRHFITHYHYPGKDAGRDAVKEAFNNWKAFYNLSLCMTYVSFIGLAWQRYSVPSEWTVGDDLLRHTLGAILIGIHMWTAAECYDVLGVFGWFFGDFFIQDYPATLEYTGIYRFLNNPERTMSGAAFFGFALISGSKLVLAMAFISHLSHWWFLSKVEGPHMAKLYGPSLRKEAGLTKIIKRVAKKNALLLESQAGRHAPELRRVAQEVKGTFDKVYGDTAEAVKEFLPKPTLSDVVQDTKVLLQQSRERLVITRLTSDMSGHDRSKYTIWIKSSNNRFHLGETITVGWRAPPTHSKRDWIGIYRKGANKFVTVTKTSSLGMWVPVHDDEWDGDIPLGSERPPSPTKEMGSGEVVFKGDALPWATGEYELRYHHDGKYNVMDIAHVEIYVGRPVDFNFESVRTTLMRIVVFALDSDPSLIPRSSRDSEKLDDDGRDPDDFNFWSERQAKRIAKAIQQTFGVEYSSEVIVADANLSALANRIMASKEILP